jgi:hypothetical protein
MLSMQQHPSEIDMAQTGNYKELLLCLSHGQIGPKCCPNEWALLEHAACRQIGPQNYGSQAFRGPALRRGSCGQLRRHSHDKPHQPVPS